MASGIQPKLTTMEVFDELSEKLVHCISQGGSCTGFLTRTSNNEPVFVTSLHSVFVRQLNNSFIYQQKPLLYSNERRIENLGTWMSASSKLERDASLLEKYLFQVAAKIDLVAYGIEKEDISLSSTIKYSSEELELGEKVYFAGFPLVFDKPSFHKGIVSSVQNDEGNTIYTIDGPIARGFSGGPVVRQRNGELELVAIITSENAFVDWEHQSHIKQLIAYREENPIKISPIITFRNGTSRPIQKFLT